MRYKLKRFILNLIYPNSCPVCGELIGFNDDFCFACRDNLTVFGDDMHIDGADGCCAAFEYDDKISPAVILLKNGVCGNSAFALGTALAERIKKSGFSDKIDMIIPVPMYRSDKRRRGYNQSELIARIISRELSIPLITDAVVKCRKTSAQKLLGRDERIKNLSGAFSVCDAKLIRGKNILLIDDVCTTGSTFAELTKLLKENGADTVCCASCCKTPLNTTNEV